MTKCLAVRNQLPNNCSLQNSWFISFVIWTWNLFFSIPEHVCFWLFKNYFVLIQMICADHSKLQSCVIILISTVLIFYLQSVPVDFCISYCLWSVWNHFGWWVLEQKNKWKWTHSVKLVKFIFLGKNRNIKSDFFFLILGIGLLYVNASVWQMLRGSIIIFTGVLSVSMVQFTF